MERILISKIKEKIGQKTKIIGWVYNIRDIGSIKFLVIRDVSGIIQVVVSGEELIKVVKPIRLESIVEIIGIVKTEKQAPGGIEIMAEEIKIISIPLETPPISVLEKEETEASLEKRMDWRWIDLRKPRKQLIFKVWTTMEMAFRKWWLEHGFIQIHSPKLMSAASEIGSELFQISYFNGKAYLAQSPQFYKQMAMASGFEKVFEIGPVFRANPSFTSRHDTEFTSYDIEMSFIESHQKLIETEQEMFVYMISEVKEEYGEEIEKEFGRKLVIPTIPFPQITMKEAKEMLSHYDIKNRREGDLSPEEERKLSEIIKEKYGHEFCFVTEYPSSVRPFYHMRPQGDSKFTKSFDLLWNGLEITTGAQREHRYEVLKKQAIEKGIKTEEIKHYLEFFKYGCPPHGGFAIGATRLLMKIFNIGNVREVTYLYRGVKRLTP
ncbi:aspartate--tRNA(Asn) ligase [Patescibacteria group bacterium]|nr:aspartate--tRNA(Asn) ligase [Patescibacteria group bacterium]MBU4458310.1 aspartate--tRNA(Asn) ligase [Patescibacteria group bacterium]MCG2695935.1 aspartate--tRNA(Asn) ligase [Candidatus Portnoybacteria bacterium]